MRKWLAVSMFILVPAIAAAAAADVNPDWAYPVTPDGFKGQADDGMPKTIQGSSVSLTAKQIGNPFGPANWFPDQHKNMPAVVANGDQGRMLFACTLCHLTNGQGHPESASLTGLPAAYIEEQMREFKNGNRKSGAPTRSAAMIRFAQAMTDEEIKQAADYFAAIKPIAFSKVVETDDVTKSYVGEGAMRFDTAGDEKEAIGRRIIELPDNEQSARNRDPRSGFVAYVPRGTLAAGQQLATTGGNGKTVQCTICHGADFKGLGNVPGIAGRSPIYLYRQLNDIKTGIRGGNTVALMKPVVEKMSSDDMMAVAAYMGSLTP